LEERPFFRWPFYVPSHSRLRGLVSLTSGIVLSAFFDPPARATVSASPQGAGFVQYVRCGIEMSELAENSGQCAVRRRKLCAGRRECFESARFLQALSGLTMENGGTPTECGIPCIHVARRLCGL
jgi:hypothetical protein